MNRLEIILMVGKKKKNLRGLWNKTKQEGANMVCSSQHICINVRNCLPEGNVTIQNIYIIRYFTLRLLSTVQT